MIYSQNTLWANIFWSKFLSTFYSSSKFLDCLLVFNLSMAYLSFPDLKWSKSYHPRIYQPVYIYITKPGSIISITGSILAKTYGESHSTFLMKYSKFPIQCSIRGGHITFLVSSTPSCLTTLGCFIYTFSSLFSSSLTLYI